MPTGIEYLNDVWNPIQMTCTPVSEGCRNCWHRRLTETRLRRLYEGRQLPDLRKNWDAPRRWRKSHGLVGVQFMGDLFHETIPRSVHEEIWKVMLDCPQHTFLVLTKRAEAMAAFVGRPENPPPNIWLGVTAENQACWDERVYPLVYGTRAAVQWVSVEPMLGPIDPQPIIDVAVDWIVCGAESGPKRRPCSVDWVARLKDEYAVDCCGPFFYKQGPGDDGKWAKMPVLDGRRWGERPKTRGADA
jgi:protein gp37